MVTSSCEEHYFVTFEQLKLEKATQGPRHVFIRERRPDAGTEHWVFVVDISKGKSDARGESLRRYGIEVA